jgi:glycerol-3-phosphate dehydrogenase (NAD(P)+)
MLLRMSPGSANPVRCAVLGAGSFGSCLAMLLAEKGYAVDLWARDERLAAAINQHHRNPRYLTGSMLPENIRATASLEEAVRGKELLLSVVPSHGVREVWTRAAPWLEPDALLVSASKGLEVGSGLTVSQIMRELLPPERHERIVVLSGPSFAREIAERRHTNVSIACPNEGFAIAAQSIVSTPWFRCYSNTDVIGVELGGALKNVVAIAVGVVDGMELGLNARAAVITRGLAEMTRLGIRLGADPRTFLGLSGVGDLLLTCTGDLSRNRHVGLEVGRGVKIDEVLGSMQQVAEGVRTTKSAWQLAQKHDVDMPITEQAYYVLYEGKDHAQAMLDLTSRQLKSETE